jgi:hypothetical protein
MSSPAWVWPGRDSPYGLVTVPCTGVWIVPEPQPPTAWTAGVVETGAGAGAEAGAVVPESLEAGADGAAAPESLEDGAGVAGAGAAGAESADGAGAGVELAAPGW